MSLPPAYTLSEPRCPSPTLFRAREAFEWPLPDANPELARLNDEFVLRYLSQFDRENLRARVRAALIEILPAGEPSVTRVADALHLSVRSLQRRLAEEATGFDALLNETRHELAVSYLRNPRYSIGEITRSEEHTSELQSLMRISYAVFCLKKKKKTKN